MSAHAYHAQTWNLESHDVIVLYDVHSEGAGRGHSDKFRSSFEKHIALPPAHAYHRHVASETQRILSVYDEQSALIDKVSVL